MIIIASSWSFILFTYIDDARSNTNQIFVISSLFPVSMYHYRHPLYLVHHEHRETESSVVISP